jgi:hypothetical protein
MKHILFTKQKCTRCNSNLKSGVNIRIDWKVPICMKCRRKITMHEKPGLFKMSEKERKMVLKRITTPCKSFKK